MSVNTEYSFVCCSIIDRPTGAVLGSFGFLHCCYFLRIRTAPSSYFVDYHPFLMGGRVQGVSSG